MLPTVVVGIGGTGKWVVTYLKQAVMEANEGRIPENVALLSFDLDAQETPAIELLTFEQGEKRRFTLDFSDRSPEFDNFSGFWARPVFSIANGQGEAYPYIYRWLKEDDAKAYRLSREDLNNIGGTGQKRQGSRVSLFLDLAHGRTYSLLNDAVSRVRGRIGPGERLRIFTVNSIAGGTGCGTFIDFAYILHHLVRDLEEVGLYGFLVLPKGFEGVEPEDKERNLMEGNCFAAFRELQRFMGQTGEPITYHQNLKDVLPPYGLRLFDVCYLLDGSIIGGESGRRVPHYNGLAPAIADFIFLHMYKGTAPDYAQLRQRIGEELKKTQDNPIEAGIYSTFGIRRYIFDVEGVIQALAHRLASDVLGWFTKLSPKAEREVANEVQAFLKNPEATPFNRNCIAYLLEHPGGINITKEALFNFLRFGTAEDISLPHLNLTEKGKVPISGILPFTAKVPSDEVKRAAENLVAGNLGSDKDIATLKGRKNSYYGVLNYYQKNHQEKFGAYLKGKVEEIMKEGEGEGALDHAFLFLVQLVTSYDRFIEGINDLFERSDFARRRKLAEDRISEMERRMTSNPSGGNQKGYLGARQHLLTFEQWELVMQYMVRIAEAHKGLCQHILEQVRTWIGTFEEGRRLVERAYRDLVDVRKDHMAIQTREHVTTPEDKWEMGLYNLIFRRKQPQKGAEEYLDRKLPHPEFTEIVRTFTWQFNGPDAEPDELTCRLPGEFKPWEELRRNPLLWNYTFVNNFLARGQLHNLRELNIMDILEWQGWSPESFHNEMRRKSAPFAAFDSTAQQKVSIKGLVAPAPIDWSPTFAEWTEVQPGGKFASGLEAKAEEPKRPPERFKYEVIHYQAKHLIKMEGFPNLKGTEETYRKRIDELLTGKGTPPLHVFLAERYATKYEHRLDRPRCLHPRVVALLKHEDVVKNFTLARVYEMVNYQYLTDKFNYTYRMSERGREEIVALGEGMVEALEKLVSDDSKMASVRSAIKENVTQLRGEKAKDPTAFANELRRLSDKIEVSSIVTAEEDLKRVMKLILLEAAQYFEKASGKRR